MTASEQLAFTRKLGYVVIALLLARVAMDVDLLRRDHALHQVVRQAVAEATAPSPGPGIEDLQARAATLGLAGLAANMRYSLLSMPLPVLFLYFIYCSRRNLSLLQVAGTEFSPGWAVGWFLIPLLNLVRPYAVLSELWRASDPDHRDALAWRQAPVPPLLLVWWLMLVMAYFGRAAVLLLLSGSGAGAVEAVPGILSASIWLQSLGPPAGLLAAYFVYQLAARQGEKRARWEILRASTPAGGGTA